MHIQRQQMNDICRRAHGYDLAVVIGGPSVSACPDYYPTFDYLHVGELGDATDRLIAGNCRDPIPRSRVPKLNLEVRVPLAELAEQINQLKLAEEIYRQIAAEPVVLPNKALLAQFYVRHQTARSGR